VSGRTCCNAARVVCAGFPHILVFVLLTSAELLAAARANAGFRLHKQVMNKQAGVQADS